MTSACFSTTRMTSWPSWWRVVFTQVEFHCTVNTISFMARVLFSNTLTAVSPCTSSIIWDAITNGDGDLRTLLWNIYTAYLVSIEQNWWASEKTWNSLVRFIVFTWIWDTSLPLACFLFRLSTMYRRRDSKTSGKQTFFFHYSTFEHRIEKFGITGPLHAEKQSGLTTAVAEYGHFRSYVAHQLVPSGQLRP